ncbi:hypothetical protein [Rhodohalobacter sulfatireducens]|uniref:Zinc-finger domain-containing protein n=1 Tax=Rhodohalobacter sulfatireducens TaxID=2911366 RepID=A0ABS9KEJ8_9BACT|nr:hypothetical protein [Rhodohalobacter sulfatireducens]MCG2589270.1 hypothetical protein [Rhodohalobacter sulfatireducens]
MKLNKDIIKKLVGMAQNVHPDEIGCDECFDQIHEFAEIKLQGKEAKKAMPLVQDHLDKCGECREEFHALLEAMKILNE